MTFGAVLDQAKALSVRPCVDIRVRCILKDVLELRQNGWNVLVARAARKTPDTREG